MPYTMLIIEPRGQRAERGPEQGAQVYEQMLAFGGQLKERGLLIEAQSLKADSAGVRLQVRAGKRTLVDGPFSEAKEMIGGFFLLDCETREQALEIAAACPAAQYATIEIRETGPCFT